MNDALTSIVRTVVPYVIGGVVSWLGTKGIHAPDNIVASAATILTFVIGSLYYILVRALETKWPKAGVLLGKPAQPSYVAPTSATTNTPDQTTANQGSTPYGG